MKTLRVVALLVSVLFSVEAYGGVTFSFNYSDGPGLGFNDAALGAARRNALELAGQNFATAFSSYNATIVMSVDGLASGNTLASAGSNGMVIDGFGDGEVVRNKVLTNGATDLNTTDVDGTVSVNLTQPWEFDINTTPSGGKFDWYSTMYHEFAHAFGFASGINTDNTGAPTGSGNSWNKFDQFLTDKDGNSVFTGTTLNATGTTYQPLVTGGASPGAGLFFNGPTSGLAGLYSPTTFSEGSSGSHLDDENAAYAGFMMLSATGAGPASRTFTVLEQNMFRDIGYTQISQVIPEPSTLMLAGLAFGFLAIGSKRKRH